MSNCICDCERIKFSCGTSMPDFNIGKCIFPEAFSVDINLQSRDDCLAYDTQCYPPNYPSPLSGFIDCCDRNKILDELVNGTYILARTSDENTFSYRFYQPNTACLEDVPVCGNDLGFPCNPAYANGILINVNASRCSKAFNGITGSLNLQVTGWHTLPCDINIVGGIVGFNTSTPSIILSYVTNQPISCDGAVTFILSGGSNTYGVGLIYEDRPGFNSALTIFPPSITINPL